jgi:hypothetical protein
MKVSARIETVTEAEAGSSVHYSLAGAGGPGACGAADPVPLAGGGLPVGPGKVVRVSLAAGFSHVVCYVRGLGPRRGGGCLAVGRPLLRLRARTGRPVGDSDALPGLA